MPMSIPQIAIICDFLEEKWPSMDLVAEMLLENLKSEHVSGLRAIRLCPRMVPRFGSLPILGRTRLAYNADRLVNRTRDYPRWLRSQVDGFDLFHVIDQSYAHLVHDLPVGRAIVTCHDLDAFRCTLEPALHRWSKLHEGLARRALSGLRKAAWVTCDSAATRDELVAQRLFPPERMTVVSNGVHPSCNAQPDPAADSDAKGLLGREAGETTEVLHVGSTIARKRIDVLLRVFAEVRKEYPHARLVRVGGSFTPPQDSLLRQLELADSADVLPPLERAVLAAVYRRAAVVLQTSEAEGFGLPVIEAMACGTPVLASDIPALREVGGSSAMYCPVGEIAAWAESVVALLRERDREPESWCARRAAGINQAQKFNWAEYAKKMVGVYQRLLA